MTQGAKADLLQAFLLLKTPAECEAFLQDLCTPAELEAMVGRFQVSRLLLQDELSYRDIQEQTGVSLATITRVARFLKQEPYQGYKIILERLASLPHHRHPHA